MTSGREVTGTYTVVPTTIMEVPSPMTAEAEHVAQTEQVPLRVVEGVAPPVLGK